MKTIEIEKKVKLDSTHIQTITRRAILLREIHIHDVYFDTSDYQYTLQNMWLRQRDQSFELKVGVKKHNGCVDHYEEITEERRILRYLGVDSDISIPEALSLKHLSPFCSFHTYRKTYRLGELNIDIDEADFGDLHYQVAEIEMMVSDTSKIPEAEQKIFHFIQELGIDTSATIHAKLSYYLYHKRLKHYQALVENRVIQPI
jgi:predicted adenylyl cyclase CyaB